jgi:hypothetical protein
MAKVLIDLGDDEMLEWAAIIAEAAGSDAPVDLDDATAIIFDAIMVDRKRLAEHIYDRRAKAAAIEATKAQLDRMVLTPTRKVAIKVEGKPLL